MGANSEISWTHHTFNPWWGCAKVSAGCAHCYAESFATKRMGLQIWGQDAERRFFGDKHWAEPLQWNERAAKAGQRHRVFCASMADVFEDRHELVPWRLKLFDLIDDTPHLDWLLLTKRPENVRMGWPGGHRRNVWRGTTCEDQANADKRIPELLDTRDLSPVEFLSCEPLLGPIELPELFLLPSFSQDDDRYTARWVIVGGESGPGARAMHPDWARGLRDQCRASGNVAFHFKQWGEFQPLSTADGRQVLPFGKYVLPTGDRPGFGFIKKGKKAAGRLLDGREWNELPTPAGVEHV